MKKINIAEIIDLIFINILMFLIIFVWAKYFNRNILYSVLISIIVLIAFNLIRSFLRFNKKNKQVLSKNLEADIEQYMLTLLSNSQENNALFFIKLFETKQPKYYKKDNFIFLQGTNIIICPMFNTQELKLEPCLKILNKLSKQDLTQIIFLCVKCDLKLKMLLEKLKNQNVKVYQKNDIYFNFLKPNNYYPAIMFEYKQSNKLKFRELINISFNKKRAKGYFLSGILIFFCSFIVRHNFYYVFMSSLLFLFTLFCLTKKEVSTQKDFFS